jgi:hypothetical protein
MWVGRIFNPSYEEEVPGSGGEDVWALFVFQILIAQVRDEHVSGFMGN